MLDKDSDIARKFNTFKRILPTYLKNIDIDGIKFEVTKHTTPKKNSGVTLDVPLIKILNPNSISFSYNSLKDLLSIELENLNKFTQTFSSNSHMYNSFDFYDFNNNDYFINNKIQNNLMKCLHNNNVEIKYRKFNSIYTIKGKYLIDSSFEMVWEDSESLQVYISFDVASVFVDDLENKKHYFLEEKDSIINLIDEIYYENSSIFENGIWYCFEDTLMDYPTFLNREWQYVNIRAYVI